ncbi:nitrate- and nitrite sensing domain-containing protein [Kitasatospora sp. NPDC052896]|uniref:sensor histidine kinase n=1 Tax=Kitasatospora sp. NPDC052896 TaxID=3364061 RepID=UPI0037CA30B6
MVPAVALAALWTVTTGQTFADYQQQAAQELLAQKAGQPANLVYYSLQEERRLSAEQLAQPGSVSDDLDLRRQLTDAAVRSFRSLSSVTAGNAPAGVRDAVRQARQAMSQLPAERAEVDDGSANQQAAYAFYTNLISTDLQLFSALGQADNGAAGYQSRTLVDALWAKEMIAREDAVLARGWPTGRLDEADLQTVQQAIGAQGFLYTAKIAPYLPAGEAAGWQQLTQGAAWSAMDVVQQDLMRPTAPNADGTVPLPPDADQWRQAVDLVTPQLVALLQTRTDDVVSTGRSSIDSLLLRLVLTSVIGLLGVVVVSATSWRLARSLRRRITHLQDQAERLERGLPELVDRLARGEQPAAAESREITADSAAGRGDELDRLGRALNAARQSAIGAAVQQAEQHRGFERLLQRIARRTQLLIGLQLKKLDQMERRHEDPEVLEGLFDLDHLTARLRRYEENLVILAGGQPQRRWRKPVPLLDVLRSAQGEVQDYRRITLDIEGSPWLSERAVGPVVHVLAELMENAAAFSKPPTPVEVRAALVGRGLAVEIEDRGLGMEPEQCEAANELMRRPPRMDVVTRADDVRLGLYVVARLAESLGLRVEFRPSAFGGTRVVVLIPAELVTDGPPAKVAAASGPAAGDPGTAELVEPVALPSRIRGRALAGTGAPPSVAPGAPALLALPTSERATRVSDRIAPEDLPGATDPAGPAPERRGGARHARRPAPNDESTREPAPAGSPPDRAGARPSWALRAAEQGGTAATPEPPLPQRVRQASLAAELRTPAAPATAPARRPDTPTRSGAAIGAFQRQSRVARQGTGSGDTQDLPLNSRTEDES